ncbi:rod shape-determining protein RodA [Salsipaludibacter albus]|uniref:rod shape-determining protein RodA n=1 Tax=Salsipaludibacter albus TaxID=2849650 RepID=UPI001EE3CB7B|nr:rod shape-determining protein RodA [Salsipaludibacter albus]MBY5162256.1 rod shape-determining protein RodA [Salsipaludibacter albus]
MSDTYFGSDRTRRIQREQVQSRWMRAYEPIRHLDPILVATALVLTGIGIAMIFSATTTRVGETGAPDLSFVLRQLVAFGVGIVAMIITAVLDYRWIRALAPILYGGSIILLVAVLHPAVGTLVNGSRRWINIGGFSLQPSELAKIAVIVAVAALLHERRGEPTMRTLLACLALAAVPAGLIFLEPDLGSAIVIVWLLFVMFLVGGIPFRWLAGLAVGGIGAVVYAFVGGFIESYQLERLTAFLDQGNVGEAGGALYQLNQSMIAIGSGQLAGQGYRQGTQNAAAFIPENHTDFIFTIVGEEFGFVGSLVILGLFVILIWRGVRIAMMSRDLFGTIVSSAIVGLLGLQVFVNVGMTIGIAPITGIPLPFVSYGGTSLIMWFALVGLLLNIHMRRFS